MKACDRVNILVVDDVPEKAAAIEDTLLKLDQYVVKAYSGRDALRSASRIFNPPASTTNRRFERTS